MKDYLKWYLVALLIFILPNIFAQDEKRKSYELTGYINDMQILSFVDNADSLSNTNLIYNRFNFKWNFAKNFYTRVGMRNRLFYGDQVKTIPEFGKLVSIDDGYFDLTILWTDKKSLVFVSVFDRMLVNYSYKKFSVTAGRQRVNWGVNTVWNPNDVFNAYNFLDFNYIERPGVDAVRLEYFLKTFSSIEFVYKLSQEKNQNYGTALFKFNKWKYDFQFLGGTYFNDYVVGAGWAGNIMDAGFKGEISYFRNRDNLPIDKENLTGSITVDQSFKNSWYVMASALYVQNPAPVLAGTFYILSGSLSAKRLMPFHYSFYSGVQKVFNPRFSGNLAVIYSPTFNSSIFFPTLTYSITDDFDLDLTAQCFFSDEFGDYKTTGNSIFFRIIWNY